MFKELKINFFNFHAERQSKKQTNNEKKKIRRRSKLNRKI